MKLNLGCGQNKLAGYLNIDKYRTCDPDLLIDLEIIPWRLLKPGFGSVGMDEGPIPDNGVAEIRANHVLEHLGARAEVFNDIMVEMYRVCQHGALIHIAVPHPRHDHFLGDPTHVRVITPEVLSLYSRANCEEWKRKGAANSSLALYLGVDFETVSASEVLDDRWQEMWDAGGVSAVKLQNAIRTYNNVVKEYRITLRVVKEGGAA